MPRRNINAQERVDKRWSPDYIRALMRKLKGGKLEQAYEEPNVEKANRKEQGHNGN
jgi:hypothetical protein